MISVSLVFPEGEHLHLSPFAFNRTRKTQHGRARKAAFGHHALLDEHNLCWPN